MPGGSGDIHVGPLYSCTVEDLILPGALDPFPHASSHPPDEGVAMPELQKEVEAFLHVAPPLATGFLHQEVPGLGGEGAGLKAVKGKLP